MKQLIKTVSLTVFLWTGAAAQPFNKLDTDNISESLNTYLTNADDGWFAYRIPAAKQTHSMCCYNQGEKAACDLLKNQHGYGSSSDSPFTDNINVFVNLQQGKVNQIMPIGDHCEVKAEGITVDWLTNVSERQSIQWLKSQANGNKNGHHNGSMYVLSLHQDKTAADALYDIAKLNADQSSGQENSEQAVFWLGQRQRDGFKYLRSLYHDLPVGEVRRKLNFALSQNETTEAVSLLKSIALDDQDNEQQADAIFWLSQTDDVADLPEFLIDMMSTTESNEIKEKAIFSLSQINNKEANHELTQLVKDHKDAEVREKALFWLAQNSPNQAQEAALHLLTIKSQESEQENAVFVLSQLPENQSTAALLKIIKGNYSRNIKKKAIFWLSQSDDNEAISQLEDLL